MQCISLSTNVRKKKFDPKMTTKNYPFHRGSKKVGMMFLYGQKMPHLQTLDYTAVQLAYSSPGWSFIAYLPHKNNTVNDILPKIRLQKSEGAFSPTTVAHLDFQNSISRLHTASNLCSKT
jgi:hypothetical protein